MTAAPTLLDSVRPIAFIYRRISHQRTARRGGRRRNAGISLDAQLAEGNVYIAAQAGWLAGEVFTDILTGGRSDRRGYQGLKARVAAERRAGQACVIVVVKLDRFGRNLREAVNTWPELQALKVPVHSTREGGLVTEAVWNRKAMAAEEELQTASERSRHGWAHIMGNGWAHVGKQTYGYCWRDSTDEEAAEGAPLAVPEVDETQARHLRHAFEMVARGESGRSAMRYLASLPESDRSGLSFAWRTVQHLLRNPFVAGWQDANETPGRWPAVIDPETWRKVQARMSVNVRQLRQPQHRYLMTSVLHCEQCDQLMVGSVVPAKPGLLVRRYRCRGGTSGGSHQRCYVTASAPAVDADVLDQVRVLLERVRSDPETDTALGVAWDELRKPPIDPKVYERERRRLVRNIDEARELGVALTTSMALGKITDQAYQDAYAAAVAQQQAATAALVAHGEPPEPTLPPWKVVSAQIDDWREVLDRGQAEHQRDLVMLLVAGAVARRVGFGRYAVDVTWTVFGKALQALVPPPAVA